MCYHFTFPTYFYQLCTEILFYPGNNLSGFTSHFAIHYCTFANRSTNFVAFRKNQRALSLVVQSLRYMTFDHYKIFTTV